MRLKCTAWPLFRHQRESHPGKKEMATVALPGWTVHSIQCWQHCPEAEFSLRGPPPGVLKGIENFPQAVWIGASLLASCAHPSSAPVSQRPAFTWQWNPTYKQGQGALWVKEGYLQRKRTPQLAVAGEGLSGNGSGGDVTLGFHKGKGSLFCGEIDDISLSDGGWFHFVFFLAINEISQALRAFSNWLGANTLKIKILHGWLGLNMGQRSLDT